MASHNETSRSEARSISASTVVRPMPRAGVFRIRNKWTVSWGFMDAVR